MMMLEIINNVRDMILTSSESEYYQNNITAKIDFVNRFIGLEEFFPSSP